MERKCKDIATFFSTDYFERTSIDVYVRRHQGAKCEHFDVSNVIYHKFSHGAQRGKRYTLNVENVNVILEFSVCYSWINYIFFLQT